jgi:uncharacterized ferredoxin-like protein
VKGGTNVPIISSDDGERAGILAAAKLMMIATRTAPKSGGVDDIMTAIVYGEEKDALAQEMETIGNERDIAGFARDGGNVRKSTAVVLIGVRGTREFGLDCGACGYASCLEFEQSGEKTGSDFTGPTCLFKSLDLGIAIGSAAKTASNLNLDNRIMYRLGVAAIRLNMMPEASVIMGIPISVKGKNVFFDRK